MSLDRSSRTEAMPVSQAGGQEGESSPGGGCSLGPRPLALGAESGGPQKCNPTQAASMGNFDGPSDPSRPKPNQIISELAGYRPKPLNVQTIIANCISKQNNVWTVQPVHDRCLSNVVPGFERF